MSTEPPSPQPKKVDPSSLFAAVFVALVVLAIPLFVWRSCSTTSPLRDATNAFFGQLKRGQAAEAYASLASSRRTGLTRAEFDDLLRIPALRGHDQVDIDGTQRHDDRWGCTRGSLAVGGEDWPFEIYLVRDGDQWRVHTWTLHEPAAIVPMNLLDQCDQW
jgi:hypothetical protein